MKVKLYNYDKNLYIALIIITSIALVVGVVYAIITN